MFTEEESRIDWGREFQALDAITGKLRSAMARYDLVTGTTNVDVSIRHESVRVLSLTCNGSCQTKG